MRLPVLLLSLLLAAAPAIAATPRGTARPGLSAGKAELFRTLSAFPKATSPLDRSEPLLILDRPLRGTFASTAFPAIASTLKTALSGACASSVIGIDSLGPVLADTAPHYRYLLAPLEVRSKIRERKLEVGSFAKLDKNGDFVITHGTRTITACDTMVAVRFVLADLAARTLVFERWERDTVKGAELPGVGVAPDRTRAALLRIARRVGAAMKSRFR